MKRSRIVAQAVLWGMAALVVLPFLWTLLNAVKLNVDILTPTPKLLFAPVLDNVLYVLERRSVLDALVNSVLVSGAAVLIGLLFGLPTAYAVARTRNRWSDEVQFFVLSLRFMPPVAVAIPLMMIWLNLGLYDTRLALVLTYSLLTISVTIWLSIPAFERVPKEIEEAARVDGYGPYRVFLRIALPVAARSLTGALAFSFVLVWNEFLMALMLTTGDAKTLPIIASEMSQLGMNVPWGILNAAVVLLSLPPLVMLGLLSSLLDRSIAKPSR